MKEILDITRAYEHAHQLGRQTALATVVHVDGSSYRRPGARMLVDDSGQLTGAISGGCLEGDALRKAMLVLSQQKAMLVTYDTMDEDDAKLGVGLGCNGIIQVLIEPIDPVDGHNPIELLKAITSKRQNAVLVTLFSLHNRRDDQPGTRLLLTQAGITSLAGLPEALVQDANNALINRATSFINYISPEQNLTAFIEYVAPPVSLVVIGAGNDVIPLISMACTLGWQTTVIDGRATHAKAERFAPSCNVIVSKPAQALDQLTIDDQTVFVLMTHNYNYDLAMLRALIKYNIPYIGSLGPKKKLTRMLDDLAAKGFTFSSGQLECLYGPTGLDIGAETPEEIALSILAEIKAVLAGRCGHPLRNNAAVIHTRVATAINKTGVE